MLKKILVATTFLLLILSLIMGASGLQLLPFIIFYSLYYLEVKEKKDVNFWIVLLAVIMALLNFSARFYFDAVA